MYTCSTPPVKIQSIDSKLIDRAIQELQMSKSAFIRQAVRCYLIQLGYGDEFSDSAKGLAMPSIANQSHQKN